MLYTVKLFVLRLMIFQMFPAYCRELGSGLSTCFGFVMFYLVIQISPSLLTTVGTSMTFYMFGLVSGLGAVFLYLCLPETKNKTLDDGAGSDWTGEEDLETQKPKHVFGVGRRRFYTLSLYTRNVILW